MISDANQAIEDNENTIKASNEAIKANRELILQSNAAILANKNLIEQSNETIRKNAEAVSSLTAMLTNIKPPTGLMALALGAFLFLLIVPSLLMVFFMWKIQRHLEEVKQGK